MTLHGVALALMLAAVSVPLETSLAHERAVTIAPGSESRACAALDGALYAAAAPALTDVRLLSAGRELPYAITLSETATQSDAARIVNLGERDGRIVFDLEMPARAYSEVELELSARDFLATANVSGEPAPGGTQTDLGTFTLFDLSAQHLGRSTRLALAEATFPWLHVELAMSDAQGRHQRPPAPIVTAASVPPSRQGQTLYTPVAETQVAIQRGRQTVATFHLPAQVPVERLGFVLEPGAQLNFSREVSITAHPDDTGSAEAERLTGTIARLHMANPLARNGPANPIAEERLSLPAILGSNARGPATVEVAIENGDDRPLPLAAVRLEMRARNLCFDVPAAPLALFYGDAKLDAPGYDFARTFQPGEPVRRATLGPELPNPSYVAAPDARGFVELHPGLVWAGLLALVGVLGWVALRSGKKL